MAKKITTQEKTIGSTSEASRNPLQIPGKILNPIGGFLRSQLQKVEKRKSELEKDDPFVSGRSENFASPDTGAAEQFGHARSEAMRKELDRKIIQIRKALARVKIGKYGVCEECINMIETERLVIYPEATICVKCERKKEKK